VNFTALRRAVFTGELHRISAVPDARQHVAGHEPEHDLSSAASPPAVSEFVSAPLEPWGLDGCRSALSSQAALTTAASAIPKDTRRRTRDRMVSNKQVLFQDSSGPRRLISGGVDGTRWLTRDKWIRASSPDQAPHSDIRVISGAERQLPACSPAQRTAVKQRPHQETRRHQVATSEPVVDHHGREGGGDVSNEARPSASTACWAAPRCKSPHFHRRPPVDPRQLRSSSNTCTLRSRGRGPRSRHPCLR